MRRLNVTFVVGVVSFFLLLAGLFQKEEIKKGFTTSFNEPVVVIPFLISLLKNEGTEQPCLASRSFCILYSALTTNTFEAALPTQMRDRLEYSSAQSLRILFLHESS